MEKKEVRDKSTLEKMRMTNILRKLEFIKMTIILGRKYSFVVTHRVSESCIMSDNIVIYNLGEGSRALQNIVKTVLCSFLNCCCC
jgi:hypothetical protein